MCDCMQDEDYSLPADSEDSLDDDSPEELGGSQKKAAKKVGWLWYTHASFVSLRNIIFLGCHKIYLLGKRKIFIFLHIIGLKIMCVFLCI